MASNPFVDQPEAGPSGTSAVGAVVPASQGTATFLRRLAGQSVNKAGLAKDQSEVNRIIWEASKGSKYYEREKVKDDELGLKIARLLKRRDELLPVADLAALEDECDAMMARLEAHRDLSRTLVHVDADAFYANCEELADPSLRGVAFGVGGGVLTTASYEARKFGVRSGMAGFIAKKLCPHLKFVKANFSSYSDFSRKIMAVLRRFDPEMAKVGMDEAFLDITAYLEEEYKGDGERYVSVEEWMQRREDAVRKIRTAVKKETGLTVSAGIAPTKMLAKISSDINKPDGQFAVTFTRDAIMAFNQPLTIRKIPGIGKVSERCLEALGVMTCSDIITHRATLHLLDYGVKHLLRAATGTTSNVREAGKREDRKSIGVERTFKDLWKKEDLIAKLEDIAEHLCEDMEQLHFTARCLSLKFKTHDYKLFTRDRTLHHGELKSKESILKVGLQLLEENLPMRVRLLGLRVTHLKDLKVTKKGALDRFVQRSPGKASPTKPVGEPDVICLLDSDDDNDEVLPQDFSELPEEFQSDLDEPPAGAKASHQPILTAQETFPCPICQTPLRSSDLALVNDHIDLCINQDAIKQASRHSSPPSAPRRIVPKKRPSDDRPSTGGSKTQATSRKTNPFDLMMKR